MVLLLRKRIRLWGFKIRTSTTTSRASTLGFQNSNLHHTSRASTLGFWGLTGFGSICVGLWLDWFWFGLASDMRRKRMYSRGSNNSYGQQSYAGQQAYRQSSAAGYSGSSIGGAEGGSQLSLPSRHSSMLATSQDTDIGSYRASNAQHGGQYGFVYGSGTLSSAQQLLLVDKWD
ncbi:hypothetical protein IFM89_037776 [Coptis chinensis]|uniref:Uncharacterized protein n=1 Tax=Coptis chinensis TaxID=261450 RepID=A0A835H7Q5_9MAGN|nr:hypothetical protein IFM89_037776 [Coptis chinensis]